MKQNFCDTHTIAFLKHWDPARPLDRSLNEYFRTHKSLGSKDRKCIGDWVYTLVRWKSLFDELDPSNSPSKRLHLLQQRPVPQWIAEASLSSHACLGLSSFLWNQFVDHYGDQKARHIAAVCNTQAPICVRANLLKTTREKLLHLWDGTFEVRPTSQSPEGIVFTKREALFALPEFKQGLFEMQDEGSQLIAQLIDAKPGDRILDYCSGSGGKSLAFAHRLRGRGEIYLHDVRKSAHKEAKVRLKRAGVQNAQIIDPHHPTRKKLLGKMDWVLVDVPCSGTGTLRRNPEMKWKIDALMLQRLIQEQQAIFAEAVQYAKPGGRIAYATCSIFPEENERQVQNFINHLPIEIEKGPLQLLPEEDRWDGFFAIVFRKLKIQ